MQRCGTNRISAAGGVCVIVALLCALASALIAAPGCRRSDSNAASSPASDDASPRTVSIAAAADLKFALDEIIAAFHATRPAIAVSATYGSSGNFHSQLTNKAPFDVYLSADIEYPRRLAEAGLTIEDSLFEYAVGLIVVWTPKDSNVDVQALGIEALRQDSVRKIAIANPQHAPYGRAAEAALKSLGAYEHVKDKLVLGENIAQTAQFIESGAADIGVIALSLALSPAMKDKGAYWPVPLDAYPPLRQGGVILKWASDVDAAREFIAFVNDAGEGGGRAILDRYGFMLPGE